MKTVKSGDEFVTQVEFKTDKAIAWQAMDALIVYDKIAFASDINSLILLESVKGKTAGHAASVHSEGLRIALQLKIEQSALNIVPILTIAWRVRSGAMVGVYEFVFIAKESFVVNAQNKEVQTGYDGDSLEVKASIPDDDKYTFVMQVRIIE